MHPRAVLFDLDGTLIDSRDYWYAVLCEAAVHFGEGAVDRRAFDASFGQASSADVVEFFPRTRVEDVDAFYNTALPRHVHLVRAASGTAELLRSLKAAAVATACVTNSPSPFTRAVLGALELLSLFDALACADEVAHPKPAPDLVHLAARRLGVPVEACVFVGDSQFDVAAGRAAGCRVVGLGVTADVAAQSMAHVGQLLLPAR
jgi:HAD superfamily hydrolase (TIGR01509 family)